MRDRNKFYCRICQIWIYDEISAKNHIGMHRLNYCRDNRLPARMKYKVDWQDVVLFYQRRRVDPNPQQSRLKAIEQQETEVIL